MVHSFDSSIYQQAWQKYVHGVKINHSTQLDDRVAQKAFEAGWSLKEIGRMLVVSSPTVKAMHREKGKAQAREYVNHLVRRVAQRGQKRSLSQRNLLKRQSEMEL
jgi:uncharacterized protein YjcR